MEFRYCAECSVAIGRSVTHNGPSCEPGKPAFTLCSTEEFEEAARVTMIEQKFPTIQDNKVVPGVPCRAHWVVGVKGGPNKSAFEISVLRDDNQFGKLSYGWFGPSKLLITHNGGPCTWPLINTVWAKQLVLAQQVVDELNAEEYKND